MTHIAIGEGLPNDILALVAHITSPLGEKSAGLVRQAAAATVVDSSPTMLNVSVPLDVPSVALENGPTPGEALVYDNDRLVGEVLVWIREGRLIGLEQAWYTDDPPTAWPRPNQVKAR